MATNYDGAGYGTHPIEGFPSQSSHLLQSASPAQLREKEDAKAHSASITSEPQPTGIRRSSAQLWSTGAVFLSAAVPLVALIVWLALNRVSKHTFDTFAGEKIGGRFTQSEAKAIDVVAGALLAPIFMAMINFVWFGSARVSVVNEQQKKAIPLRSLVAASGTYAGSYDLFHLRDLLQGKTWRLFLLGLLTLLSAVSRTALTNIIAYEAYTDEVSWPSILLRLQRDAAIESSFTGPQGFLYPTNIMTLDIYDFSPSQQADVAKQISALLSELTFQNASSKLTDGAYIGINATTQSLNALPQTVIALHNVPAYRLSINCTPDVPTTLSVTQPLNKYNTDISLMLNTTTTSNNTIFQAFYPGPPEAINSGDTDAISYVAFALGAQEAYLGHLNRFNLTNDTLPSKYGTIHHAAFNMTPWGFSGTQSTMSARGLRCVLHREDGAANLTRPAATNPWATASTSFTPQPKTTVASMLTQWQYRSLNFHAPSANAPGIGPALSSAMLDYGVGQSTSFDDFALNYLFASGEAQRIAYEVAASTSPSDRASEIEVAGRATLVRYRITYVPALLLLALLCLIAAAVLVGGMALRAAGAASSRAWRMVGPVRVVVDAVAGLGSGGQGGDRGEGEMARVAAGGNGVVEEWAARYKVRYERVEGEEGVRVVLGRG